MNKRKAKKTAKRFLSGEKNFPTYEDMFIYSTDGDYVVKVMYRLPGKIYRAVREEASRRGWGGCHWDAPDLAGYYEGESREYVPNAAWSTSFRPLAGGI